MSIDIRSHQFNHSFFIVICFKILAGPNSLECFLLFLFRCSLPIYWIYFFISSSFCSSSWTSIASQVNVWLRKFFISHIQWSIGFDALLALVIFPIIHAIRVFDCFILPSGLPSFFLSSSTFFLLFLFLFVGFWFIVDFLCCFYLFFITDTSLRDFYGIWMQLLLLRFFVTLIFLIYALHSSFSSFFVLFFICVPVYQDSR